MHSVFYIMEVSSCERNKTVSAEGFFVILQASSLSS